MTYVVTGSCIDVKDRACVEVCPVDCIYEGPRMLYIHPDECVDCGACEPVCPTEAIFAEMDVPDAGLAFVEVNAEAVEPIGSPGAGKQVRVPVDPPMVRDMVVEEAGGFR